MQDYNRFIFRYYYPKIKKMSSPVYVFSIDFSVDLNKEDEEFIIMQYTGLCDKNGNKIFEGDIVKMMFETRKSGAQIWPVGTIVWEPAAFSWKPIKERAWDDSYNSVNWWQITLLNKDFGNKDFGIPGTSTDRLEIIGNIYENPELLEITGENIYDNPNP